MYLLVPMQREISLNFTEITHMGTLNKFAKNQVNELKVKAHTYSTKLF